MESGCLRLQLKEDGKPHLRLNTTTRPIVDKYHEEKLQRTLKRESRGLIGNIIILYATKLCIDVNVNHLSDPS
ncbi:Uncharacterized protein BM_BM177 [Brugia malayi]|uniref:Bm177 n=1 Tax=Brugia malayi TaxID=6279 RepID=A0A0K0J302_BRUMA|nr:Bm177 [Brugia malayi]VIO87709.1 Uncharacterized protein BM_BM177 [Brugia malayi]